MITNADLAARQKISELVNIVAAAGGSEPGTFYRDGFSAFDWEQGQGTLRFDAGNQSQTFVAHLDVARIPKTTREQFFERLLHLNWDDREMQGAFLAIDDGASRVLLCHWFPADMPQVDFTWIMQRFLSLAAVLREKLTLSNADSDNSQESSVRKDLRILNHV